MPLQIADSHQNHSFPYCRIWYKDMFYWFHSSNRNRFAKICQLIFGENECILSKPNVIDAKLEDNMARLQGIPSVHIQ